MIRGALLPGSYAVRAVSASPGARAENVGAMSLSFWQVVDANCPHCSRPFKIRLWGCADAADDALAGMLQLASWDVYACPTGTLIHTQAPLIVLPAGERGAIGFCPATNAFDPPADEQLASLMSAGREVHGAAWEPATAGRETRIVGRNEIAAFLGIEDDGGGPFMERLRRANAARSEERADAAAVSFRELLVKLAKRMTREDVPAGMSRFVG